MKNWMEFIKQPNAKQLYGGRVLISKETYEAIQADAINFPVRTRTDSNPPHEMNDPKRFDEIEKQRNQLLHICQTTEGLCENCEDKVTICNTCHEILIPCGCGVCEKGKIWVEKD